MGGLDVVYTISPQEELSSPVLDRGEQNVSATEQTTFFCRVFKATACVMVVFPFLLLIVLSFYHLYK